MFAFIHIISPYSFIPCHFSLVKTTPTPIAPITSPANSPFPSLPKHTRCTTLSPTMSLANRTAVVTGATRGIGRGIAIALAEQGAHVIITGRTTHGSDSLEHTAAAVVKAGGTCQTHVVDHAADEQVAAWFQHQLPQQLAASNRSLDIFVNNAYAGVSFLIENENVPFWRAALPDGSDDPAAAWDVINTVGLRGNYICGVYATRLMERAGGVVVNVTSWGGLVSIFHPAYCVGKAGVDRMHAEFARAAPGNVAFLTLCPGVVATDTLRDVALLQAERLVRQGADPRSSDLPLWNMETPLFVGRVLAGAVADRSFADEVSGKIVVVAEAADRLKIDDENGLRPLSIRSIRLALQKAFPSLIESPFRHLVPRSLVVPWLITQHVAGVLKYWN